ncbi:hypothetical protein Hypma_014425 [Hypsizygus marmoreus]|uniref:Uncharacterized protein n=1 Tax=Hypsizygus marmoreus TaxID=39966 RepID=A0A369JJN4_HYPMA|nr:hypothetical protein Hypma_014425 [Hypsizygus marmoreus]
MPAAKYNEEHNGQGRMHGSEKKFKEYRAYFQERRFAERQFGVNVIEAHEMTGGKMYYKTREVADALFNEEIPPDAAINVRVANTSNFRRPASRLPFKRCPQHRVAQHVLGCFLSDSKSIWAPRKLNAITMPDRIRDGLKEFKFDKPVEGVKKLSYSHTLPGAEAIRWPNQ